MRSCPAVAGASDEVVIGDDGHCDAVFAIDEGRDHRAFRREHVVPAVSWDYRAAWGFGELEHMFVYASDAVHDDRRAGRYVFQNRVCPVSDSVLLHGINI